MFLTMKTSDNPRNNDNYVTGNVILKLTIKINVYL